MWKLGRFIFRSGNKGITTIEVIAAIAVFSVLAVAVLGASVQMMQTYTVIQTSLDESQEVSLIDSAVRNAVQSVRFPYWYSALPIKDDSASRFVITGVDGDKTKALKLEFFDDAFTVSTGTWEDGGFSETEKQQFRGITSFSWELLADQWRGSHGIRIQLERGEDKDPIVCKEEFGSFLLKEKE